MKARDGSVKLRHAHREFNSVEGRLAVVQNACSSEYAVAAQQSREPDSSLCKRKHRGASVEQDERAIRELIATWLRASAAGDTEQVLRLMADDVVFLTPGHPPMRGKAAFAAGQAALKQFRIDATSEVQEIRVFGARP